MLCNWPQSSTEVLNCEQGRFTPRDSFSFKPSLLVACSFPLNDRFKGWKCHNELPKLHKNISLVVCAAGPISVIFSTFITFTPSRHSAFSVNIRHSHFPNVTAAEYVALVFTMFVTVVLCILSCWTTVTTVTTVIWTSVTHLSASVRERTLVCKRSYLRIPEQ